MPKIFQIENPPFIPNPGDIVQFNAEEFTDDRQTIENFIDFQDNDLFFCDLHSKTYGKEKDGSEDPGLPGAKLPGRMPVIICQVNNFAQYSFRLWLFDSFGRMFS